MLICFLGYNKSETTLIDFLKTKKNKVFQTNKLVLDLSKYDLVICFGYRHLLKDSTISSAKRKIINLHISYLPHNRGAHPNFWSFMHDTPKGITIHEIDQGIDTGNIIYQKKIDIDPKKNTFKSSYNLLKESIEKLFTKNWRRIKDNEYNVKKIREIGSINYKKDLPKWLDEWDTRISKVKNKFIDREKFNFIIILSNDVTQSGEINEESKARAKIGFLEFKKMQKSKIVLSGSNLRTKTKKNISELMAKYLWKNFDIKKSDILISKNSLDTVGDAIFTKIKIMHMTRTNKIKLVTSQYHVKRAREIFQFVYGTNYKFSFIPVKTKNSSDHKNNEMMSLKKFKKTFRGIEPGNTFSILKTLQIKHPFYNGECFPEWKKFNI